MWVDFLRTVKSTSITRFSFASVLVESANCKGGKTAQFAVTYLYCLFKALPELLIFPSISHWTEFRKYSRPKDEPETVRKAGLKSLAKLEGTRASTQLLPRGRPGPALCAPAESSPQSLCHCCRALAPCSADPEASPVHGRHLWAENPGPVALSTPPSAPGEALPPHLVFPLPQTGAAG